MPISGRQAIRILQKKHSFTIARQRGSHVVLTKQISGKKQIVVVPDHKELRRGTLASIARQAGINSKDLK